MARRRPSDRRVVLLPRPVAEELADLVEDRPGDADEDLLDDALDAVRSADGKLGGDAQQKVADGEAIAVEMDGRDREVLSTLIREDSERDRKRLGRLGRALRSKLSTAEKKTSTG